MRSGRGLGSDEPHLSATRPAGDDETTLTDEELELLTIADGVCTNIVNGKLCWTPYFIGQTCCPKCGVKQ
jgi:hypothetical protein